MAQAEHLPIDKRSYDLCLFLEQVVRSFSAEPTTWVSRRSIPLPNGGNLEVLMAILNVKNLPDALYRKLRDRARRQHRSISQEVDRSFGVRL